MARNNTSRGFGRLVTSTLKLLNKIFNRPAPKSQAPQPTPKRQRPAPPRQTPQRPAPSDYEREIQELKRQLQEKEAEIEQLKTELKKTPPVPSEEEITPEIFEIPSLPEPEEEEITPEIYEIPSLPEESTESAPEIDTTYRNFGAEDSLNQILDFLGDANRSGVSESSAFFTLDAMQQRALVIDYVEFQHEANPSLFYKGKKALELENVPIWGAEFERFVNNTIEFHNTAAPDGNFTANEWDNIIDDLVDEFDV